MTVSMLVRAFEQQATGLVETLEAAGQLTFRQAHADFLADAGGTFEPVGADRRQSPARSAIAPDARVMAGTSAANTCSGVSAAPAAARSVAGWFVLPGCETQLTPMPMATVNTGWLSPSIKMPASLSPPSKRSFGHFTFSARSKRRRARD